MRHCRAIGAEYLTFLGGEPTLHPDLPAMVAYASDLGYTQITIDTNGLAPSRIRRIPSDLLHYVSVSLDGATSSSHDRVRGEGRFVQTVSAIREFVGAGYPVRINCTVFSFNLGEAEYLLDLAESLGVKLVNFHSFSEEGLGTGKVDWSLKPQEWIEFYKSLRRMRRERKIGIWFPPTWSRPEDLPSFVEQGFSGCLGCSLDRLSIFPDGRAYVCSVLFDHPLNFAWMTDGGLELNRGQNEFDLFMHASFSAVDPVDSGCPAEALLEGANSSERTGLVSMCRCWKEQV